MVFNFNTPQTTTAATGGFSFGASASTAPVGGGFGQQTATTATTGGFGFGQPTTATTAASGGFGQPVATTAAATGGFSFGQTATNTTEPKPTFNFAAGTTGTADATAKPFGGFGGTSAPAPAATPATTKAAAPLSFIGQTTTTTAVPSTYTFAPPTATSTAAVAAAGAPTITTGATLGKANPTTSVTGPTSTATTSSSGFTSLTTATKTTDSSTVSTTSQMSFNQIEEYINKWTLEFEEQEKVFLDQATQINAWDRVLNNNSNLILELNDAVQKVMTEQSTLECELAYIENQHRDVDENIQILEKEFTKLPQVDVERSQAYLLVENLDTQLKQMSEDLKEIIDNLNETSQLCDTTDPIIQIGKILNAHMNSLRWVESTASKCSKRLEEAEKLHDKYKRENERVRNAYYR